METRCVVAMTSVDVPEDLLRRAMDVLGARTKREAIITSLQQVVDREEQAGALDDLAAMTQLADLLDPRVQAKARR